MKNENSLTHKEAKDFFSKEEINEELQAIKNKLIEKYKEDKVTLEELSNLLNELSSFELGRFLIHNKGSFSGYWTYYIIMGYNKKIIDNMIEKFVLTQAPSVLATRERFGIFQKLLRATIKSNSVFCSVPCGVMADFSTLEINNDEIKDVKVVGIDLDGTVFDTAKKLMDQYKPKTKVEFFQKNAWDMGVKEEFDALTSNGLNIYEPDDSKVIKLYEEFFKSLKPGGTFIGSALSDPKDEWARDKIDKDNLGLQKKLFAEILQASWQNFRTCDKSKNQLQAAGFKDIEIYWDSQKIFYTFTAKKPKEPIMGQQLEEKRNSFN